MLGMNYTTPITKDIFYVGASDRRLALFENAYPLTKGMAYNSYLLMDEKTVLLDTVDQSVERDFAENVKAALKGRKLDYVIVNHMEPDHCATLGMILADYPEAIIKGTAQVKKMIQQFYGIDVSNRFEATKEGDELNTGKHLLKFIAAPMVHWPEVMMTYDSSEKILFSADAFGKFGALSGNLYEDEAESWKEELSEARRYYANIVGKFGPQVQAVLKKAAALDIKMICPLHGPILRENIAFFLDKYDKWSSYTAEDNSVLIACGSIYGGTENAANVLASKLAQKGVKKIRMYDISSTHFSYIVGEAFRCKAIVFAAPTLDTGLFSSMETLLAELKNKNLSNRTVALIENGTWAPQAAKHMTALLETMKNINILEQKLSIKSRLAEADEAALDAMADALAESLK